MDPYQPHISPELSFPVLAWALCLVSLLPWDRSASPTVLSCPALGVLSSSGSSFLVQGAQGASPSPACGLCSALGC